MLTDGRVEDGVLHFNFEFTRAHSRDDRARMLEALLLNLKERWPGPVVPNVMVEGVRRGGGPAPAQPPPPGKEKAPKDPVRGMSGPGMQAHGGPVQLQPIEGVRHVIAVASGKGGVGKSTIATNLAVALAHAGHAVGLMDADIYGPSLPLMMNVQGRPVANAKRQVIPLMSYGVKCMSIGFMVDDTEPIIWRGPMVMGVVRQFLQDVAWAPLDVLVVDLPPGTGDAQLTMIQNVPIAGAVIVTTPQDIALLDANRGLEMFRKLDVPVLGVVENMSWFELPDGGRMHPFGEGGGARMAARYGVDLLGRIPLDGAIREGGDSGTPVALGSGAAAVTFAHIARVVAAKLGL
ncbi:MAG: Mrp/NBP35 family ATP-binding protein [Alphaproteobacteria bacterium]|nr:Mrp/NBP35 family ATP-binding protein [Alphaproteobacteria bacterium]